MTNHFHQKSRCAWHCMDLVVDGGTCNAILYDRKSKVMVYKRYMILIRQGLKEKGCFCVEYNSGLSNGRGQACGSPNWGHWSKGCLEQVREAMPFVSISSCNSGNIENSKCIKHGNIESLQLNICFKWMAIWLERLVCCGQEDARWTEWLLPQVNLGYWWEGKTNLIPLQ